MAKEHLDYLEKNQHDSADVPFLFGAWHEAQNQRPAAAEHYRRAIKADANKVEAYARRRLQSIFRFVSEPIPLLTRRGLRQFSLFLASGNPSPQAIELIKRGVEAQLKKYGRPASHRMSGH